MRLRVIAGELGGRFFQAPPGKTTHPMGERVRGALFNKLADDINGATVLDAYAGSGALSFESISRGAAHTTAIERDRLAQKIIAENVESLGIAAKVKLIKANARAWSETSKESYFDIILCDPPFNDLKLSTIAELATHLKPNGLMVLSYVGSELAPTVNGVVVVDKSNYGNAALAIYRKRDA